MQTIQLPAGHYVPGRLSDELLAAGVPVVSVRVSRGGAAEVVAEDAADPAAVLAGARAHDPDVEDRAETDVAALRAWLEGAEPTIPAAGLPELRDVIARLTRLVLYRVR